MLDGGGRLASGKERMKNGVGDDDEDTGEYSLDQLQIVFNKIKFSDDQRTAAEALEFFADYVDEYSLPAPIMAALLDVCLSFIISRTAPEGSERHVLSILTNLAEFIDEYFDFEALLGGLFSLLPLEEAEQALASVIGSHIRAAELFISLDIFERFVESIQTGCRPSSLMIILGLVSQKDMAGKLRPLIRSTLGLLTGPVEIREPCLHILSVYAKTEVGTAILISCSEIEGIFINLEADKECQLSALSLLTELISNSDDAPAVLHKTGALDLMKQTVRSKDVELEKSVAKLCIVIAADSDEGVSLLFSEGVVNDLLGWLTDRPFATGSKAIHVLSYISSETNHLATKELISLGFLPVACKFLSMAPKRLLLPLLKAILAMFTTLSNSGMDIDLGEAVDIYDLSDEVHRISDATDNKSVAAVANYIVEQLDDFLY